MLGVGGGSFSSKFYWGENSPSFRGSTLQSEKQAIRHNTQHPTHNTQHTTHNTQHTTHNTQHTTHNTTHKKMVCCYPSIQRFHPSFSTETPATPQTLCAVDPYGSVDDPMHRVRSRRSSFSYFGCQYCIHKKIERGIGPWPHVAAVWSKKHSNQPKVDGSNSMDCG
jgi:hypothetical protein